jgi:outer membrane protein
MRVKSPVFPCVRIVAVYVLGLLLFASGPAVSASGQDTKPAQTPAQPLVRPAPTSTLRIGGDEAVRLALENNLNLQIERLNPQLQTLAVSRALSVYTPELFGSTAKSSATSPPRDFLSQGVAVTTGGNVVGEAGVRQNLKWFGGAYEIGMTGGRSTSDAPRTPFSPQLTSDLDFGFTQPLLRGLTIDSFRQSILQSRKQLEIADVQLAQRIAQTSRAVRNSYFNLVSAISSMEVAEQSLELARTLLKNNQRRVEVGTMAPIEIIEAEAEVARQEETVIARQAFIQSAEDLLRTLIMNPSQPDFWTTKIEPAELPVATARPIDAEGAIRNALSNRTDMVVLRKQIELSDLAIKFNQNQKLPAVNLNAAYGLTGIGGTQFLYGEDPGDGRPPSVINTSQRSFGDVLRDVFGNEFKTWRFSVTVSYPIGQSQSDVALASSRLERQQGLVAQRQLEVEIARQVREAVRDVTTSLQRVEATRKARDFAERRLEAENKRLSVGMSDTFRLFQTQRDLTSAKQNELTAIIDYNRALIELESVQIVPLAGGGF